MGVTVKGFEIESPFQTAVGKKFDPTTIHDGLGVEELEALSVELVWVAVPVEEKQIVKAGAPMSAVPA